MGENIPLTPVRGSTWEPEREQETSFRGESQRIRLLKEDVKKLHQKLSERYQLPEERHSGMFEIRNRELYSKGVDKPLTYNKGRLKTVGEIYKILGKNRLCALGFYKSKGELTAEQAIILNRVEEELPSASDIAKADDIELQEITENTRKSTEDLIAQFEGQETLPIHELLGLEQQLRSSSWRWQKMVQFEESIKKEKH